MRRVACGLALGLVVLVGSARTVSASVIWEGNTSRGSANFEGVELQPGRFGVTSDPNGQFGSVFYCETYDGDPNYTGKERCEMKGTKLADGSVWRMSENGEYWVGWRSMWKPMPTENGAWIAFMQFKGSDPCDQWPGATSCPLVIQALGDGKLRMHLNCGDNTQYVWEAPYPPSGTWVSFVLHWKLTTSLSTGWVELWYNGVQQVFNGAEGNGTTRQPAALWACDYQRLKFGVYRSGALNGSGTARSYLWRPRVGTTYADVAPGGGPAPTPTPTPTRTPTSGSGPTPTPTATPAGGGGFSGYYKIVSRGSGKVAAVQNASTSNGALVIQWDYGTAHNDEWTLVATDSGYYKLLNRRSGKSMAVQGASTAAGAAVLQWDFGTAQNDQWQMVSLGNGYYRVNNRKSGLVLDVKGASTSNGAQIEQWTSTGGNNQQWQLVSVP